GPGRRLSNAYRELRFIQRNKYPATSAALLTALRETILGYLFLRSYGRLTEIALLSLRKNRQFQSHTDMSVFL
ncbi:MAG: hypothetical protein KDE31_15775, partial [Caldilineaceae bacterium]|nr:hypothetical protein [Caldilineaceae bacterium]